MLISARNRTSNTISLDDIEVVVWCRANHLSLQSIVVVADDPINKPTVARE